MRTSPSLPAALAALALVTGLAACTSSAPEAERSTTTTTVNGSVPATTGGGPTSTTTGATSTTGSEPEPNGSTTAVPSGDDSFCKVLADYIEANASEFTKSDGEDYRRITKIMRERGDALVANAPDEIREPIEVFIAAQDQVIEALEAVDYQIEEVDPADISALDTPELEEASRQVRAYANDPCGIDVSLPGTPGSPISSDTVVVD